MEIPICGDVCRPSARLRPQTCLTDGGVQRGRAAFPRGCKSGVIASPQSSTGLQWCNGGVMAVQVAFLWSSPQSGYGKVPGEQAEQSLVVGEEPK